MQKRVEPNQLHVLDEHVSRIEMSPCVRELWARIVVLARERPDCSSIMSSLMELLAGIDYAATDERIGTMQALRHSYALASEPAILVDLRRYAQDALKHKKYRDPDLWFQLRARVMDAHALCVACASQDPLIIYYAGCKHTRCFSEFMTRHKGAKRQIATHNVLDALPIDSLTCVEQLHCANKTMVLLGEHHDKTHTDFADALLRLLKQYCNRETPCTFMIERHIENSSDTLQQNLMCNIPKCALHRARCDDFFRHQKDTCTGLSVHFVDSRHVDCGFLRREILDAWHVDPVFRRKAMYFQKRALGSVIYFANSCL